LQKQYEKFEKRKKSLKKKQYKKLQNQNWKKMLSGTNGPPYSPVLLVAFFIYSQVCV